jgi:SNF2 family DNA or RNA helicase
MGPTHAQQWHGSQGWQLPAKNKHAAPSKIRMIDITASPDKSNSTLSDLHQQPQPPLPHSHHQPFQDSANHMMKEGMQAIKHAWKDGMARLEQAVDEANRPRPGVAAHRPNPYGLVSNGKPLQGTPEDDDEDKPPPDTFGGPALTAEEREQQLQDMLNSMVLPPELGDIDLEKASRIDGLKCKLLPHQVAGYLWLKGRESGKYKGGILADDMGVGKTVQMLALIVGNAPHVADTTIDKIRYEEEQKKKNKKKVLRDETDDDHSVKTEKLELKSKATLIVAPLAVIRQWEREIKEKTNAGLRVMVHHGPSRVKTAAQLAKYDVIITTYSTVASEWNNATGMEKPKKKEAKNGRKKNAVVDSSEEDEDRSRIQYDSNDSSDDDSAKKVYRPQRKTTPPAPLFDVDWMRVVLDEAQNIKNHRTKASMACAALARRTLSKWCLSGTPIQNEALEMFSLIRFLAIPPFNEYAHFREKISDPLKSTNQNRVNWGMKRLCAVLTTIMLRRTKDTVHEGKPIIILPKRHVNVLTSDFDDHKERAFYKDLEDQVKRNLEDAEDSGKRINHMVTLLMLLRLRQACSHPALVNRSVRVDAGAANGSSSVEKSNTGAEGAADDDDDGLTELLAGLSVATKRCDRCQIDLSREESANGATYCPECRIKTTREENKSWNGKSSTKIRTMLRILDKVRNENEDEKAIVFSQFTSFLDLLQPFLDRAGHRYVRYDGSMRPDERERALDSIRSDPKVRLILISFKAGNVGLNLTCCSHVILMDLWWNPMLEAQSIDRAHRLGQQRDVHVYKLVIKDSVEERILALQDKKRALAEAALEGSKLSKANKLDRKELMYLFSGGPAA